MRGRRRAGPCAVLATLGAALLWLPGPAYAVPPPESGLKKTFASAGRYATMGVDLVIVRPITLAATVVGPVLFVPVAIISAPQGMSGIREAWELFVTVPAEHTFTRPLGEF
jgi:hypothetical protein